MNKYIDPMMLANMKQNGYMPPFMPKNEGFHYQNTTHNMNIANNALLNQNQLVINTQNNINTTNSEYRKVFIAGFPVDISDVFLIKLFEVRKFKLFLILVLWSNYEVE